MARRDYGLLLRRHRRREVGVVVIAANAGRMPIGTLKDWEQNLDEIKEVQALVANSVNVELRFKGPATAQCLRGLFLRHTGRLTGYWSPRP
ncbi:hypothetical protein [Lacipirellula sp.]|uniref:hypothetical protein n=1 Tax=Lacipirellula sp. TaxID=2691419 RepID=UPI003D0C19CB